MADKSQIKKGRCNMKRVQGIDNVTRTSFLDGTGRRILERTVSDGNVVVSQHSDCKDNLYIYENGSKVGIAFTVLKKVIAEDGSVYKPKTPYRLYKATSGKKATCTGFAETLGYKFIGHSLRFLQDLGFRTLNGHKLG